LSSRKFLLRINSLASLPGSCTQSCPQKLCKRQIVDIAGAWQVGVEHQGVGLVQYFAQPILGKLGVDAVDPVQARLRRAALRSCKKVEQDEKSY
jgi:hypothetical protein